MRWTDEMLMEESRKYGTRTEFARRSNSAYKHSLRRGLLDRMPWLVRHTDDRPRCVYAYEDHENMVAYIGLTVDKESRHRQHMTGRFSANKSSNSPVYEHFSSLGRDVPEPKYLEGGLTVEEAQEMEKVWSDRYVADGYVLLNRAKVGRGCGSLGLRFKWTDEMVLEESMKYTNRRDFKRGSPYPFECARKRGLFRRMPWLGRLVRAEWTRVEVFEESRRYRSRTEFGKMCAGAYNVAIRNGWLDEMPWLQRPEKKTKWTEELVFEESRKYRNRNEFGRKSSRAYEIARKNGWLDRMPWLGRGRKKRNHINKDRRKVSS